MAIGSATFQYKSNEVAPNIYRMGWRRFVNELLLISPLLFLACITVQARTRVESFRPVEYTAGLDQKIAAYIEPVRQFERCRTDGLGNPDPASLRRVGQLWRSGVLNGTLVPLLPETTGDSTRDGIKGQIRGAADELGSQLQRLARKNLELANYEQAASDALLSIEALQSIKYSDLYAVGIIATRQNNGLAILSQCFENLTPEQRKSLASRIGAIKASERSVVDLVIAEQRALSDDRQDHTWTNTHRKRLELMLAIARQIDQDRIKHEIDELPVEMKKMGRSDDTDSILPSLRFAWNARRNGNEDWRNIEAKLTLAGAN